MEEDANVDFELSCLVSNIKKEVVGVFDTFLSFLKEYEEKKIPNYVFFDVGP
jgi:hypothetical protein